MAEENEPKVHHHWLLQGLSESERDLLLRDGYEICFEPGEIMFREGDEPDGLYFITAGSARIIAAGLDGGTTIATVGANEVMGELGVLDGRTRMAQATAIGVCCAYFVTAEAFLDVLERSPQMGMRLMALLTKRLRQVNGRLGEIVPTSAITYEVQSA